MVGESMGAGPVGQFRIWMFLVLSHVEKKPGLEKFFFFFLYNS